MEKEYKFSQAEIEKEIPSFTQKGISEFSIHDEQIAKNKNRIINILNLIQKNCPDLFISILIDASCVDKDVVRLASTLFCSFDIPLTGTEKAGKFLFDKKFYANKAKLLNDFGMVFGFQLYYANEPSDSLKLFTERLDFAVRQYPNHIDFPQIENLENESTAKVTGLFSAKEIRFARDLAFSCKTFYSEGRAVSWMQNVLNPLKIYPSKFLSDFAEWQRCNNCDYKSGFVPEKENHKSIEKMQLLFLQEKYEEKNLEVLVTLVHDVVCINGAFSRLMGENEESELELSYNPEDLLSEEVFNLEDFYENVCMMPCKVRIFMGKDGPDYSLLNGN